MNTELRQLIRENVADMTVTPMGRPHKEATPIVDQDGEAHYELTRHETPESGMTILRVRVSGAIGERIRMMEEFRAMYGEPIPTEQELNFESIGVGEWQIEYAVPDGEAEVVATTEAPS